VEDPLIIDVSEDLDKKSCSIDIDNTLIMTPTNHEEDSLDEKIIKDLSTLFSTQREITYDSSDGCLLPKM
jgi:hypothetical protein